MHSLVQRFFIKVLLLYLESDVTTYRTVKVKQLNGIGPRTDDSDLYTYLARVPGFA